MDAPAFPLIAFTPVVSVRIYRDENEFRKIRFSAWAYQTFEQYAFDAEGTKWRFQYKSPSLKTSFWNELRNPVMDISVEWRRQSGYSLDDLKAELFMLIDRGDEVMTEYEQGKFLKSVLKSCSSFNGICKMLSKYVLEVNEAELWHEQEQR
jgi:hypothetical protein